MITVLFMGSQKFRGPNDWDKFVKETGGGTSNARTDLDSVSYFSVSSRSDDILNTAHY